MKLLFALAWRTIAARPTLALLGGLLLALTTSLLCGLLIAVSVISETRGSLLNELAIEIELTDNDPVLRESLTQQLRAHPDILAVQALSPSEVLAEVERELGESLIHALPENPFPPILRVKLREPTPERIAGFITHAQSWAGVRKVVYPRELSGKLDNWIAALRGRVGIVIALAALIGWTLVGLSIRAMLRNRRAAWQLLLLTGIRPMRLLFVQLIIMFALGIMAGLVSIVILNTAIQVGSWLFLSTLATPTVWPIWCLAAATMLGLLAALWAPRLSRIV